VRRFYVAHPAETQNRTQLSASNPYAYLLWVMGDQHKPDEWLKDIAVWQHNVVFPNTVQNEARFWRNLGKRPRTASIKVGLALLALLGWGFFGVTLAARPSRQG
jgi:hypothetical protein